MLPSGERFSAVQDVLDRNAVLIRQVGANHDDRTAASVAANVPLLHELSAGVQRAVDLYRDVAEALLGTGGAGGTTTGPEEEEEEEEEMQEAMEEEELGKKEEGGGGGGATAVAAAAKARP